MQKYLAILASLFLALPAFGATYTIGTGKQFATISAAPWPTLLPGDVVQIYPGTYHEKILLSASGTTALPITVSGMPDVSGNLPIIDGTAATTDPKFAFPYNPPLGTVGTADRGLWVFTRPGNQPYGYIPSNWVISNLQFQNASWNQAYTNFDGVKRTYSQNVAGVWVERGQNITVRGCTISTCSNGFFVSSGDAAATLSAGILLDSCWIHDCGNIGKSTEHGIYTEALGTTVQGCHIGKLLPGAMGNALKDRSAGTVIKYNYIESGGHMLDLVDEQSQNAAIYSDPSYQNTFVYGNWFLNTTTQLLIHFGGDSGSQAAANYRKNLYFFNNSVSNQVPGTTAYYSIMFQTDGIGTQNIFCDNNIFHTSSTTQFLWLQLSGNLILGNNWVTKGWTQNYFSGTFSGTVTGLANLINGVDPGFTSLVDLHLKAALPGTGPIVAPRPPLDREYVIHQKNEPRTSLTDFGAEQFAAAVVIPPVVATYTLTIQASPGATITIQGVDANGIPVGNPQVIKLP